MKLTIINTGSESGHKYNALGVIGPGAVTLTYKVNHSQITRIAQDLRADALAGQIIWYLDQWEPNVLQYGADPTGVTDSLAAFQAAAAAASAKGDGTVLEIPKGLYKLSGQWLLGSKYALEAQCDSMIPSFADINSTPNYNGTLFTAALALPAISIRGHGAVLWWGGSEPGTETAIMAYCLPLGSKVSPAGYFIEGLAFAGPATYTGSPPTFQSPDTSIPPTTNVSGLFIPGSEVSVRHCSAREVHRGFISASSFWGTFNKCDVWHARDGFDFYQYNAGEASNLTASYCGQGYTVTGQGTKLRMLNTEQCGSILVGTKGGDLWVPQGDQISLDGGYLEGVGTTLCADYGIHLGTPSNFLTQSDPGNGWSNVADGTANTATANAAVGPDGTMTAALITMNSPFSGGGYSSVLNTATPPQGPGVYTFSIWLKAGTLSSFPISALGVGSSTGNSATLCTLTSSWQRFSTTITVGGDTSNPAIWCKLGADSSNGSGFSFGTGTLYAWGAQFNAGPQAAWLYPTRNAMSDNSGRLLVWMAMDNLQFVRENGKSVEMVQAQLSCTNTRLYDTGSDANRLLAHDNFCIIKARASSIPLNPATLANASVVNETPYTTQAFFIGVNAVAQGRSIHQDYVTGAPFVSSDVASVAIQLPAGWVATANIPTTGTIRVIITNNTGGIADFPTSAVRMAVMLFSNLG